MKYSTMICGLGAALVLAACSGTDVTTPAAFQLSAVDSAQAAAISASDATAEDVNVMSATEGSMDGAAPMYDLLTAPVVPVYSRIGAPVPASMAATANPDSTRYAFWSFSSACTYSASTGRFACPDVVKNGLTLSRSAAFFDVNGVAMSRYNDTTTASANFQVTVSGVRIHSEGADTISRQRNMTVTGLFGRETSRTWNGTGVRSDAGYRQDSTKTRTYRTQDTVTFASIVVNLPRSQNPWPMSGTVTRRISGNATVTSATATRTFSVSKTVTITFNGTRLVPMTVGTMSFTLDLYTGKVVKT